MGMFDDLVPEAGKPRKPGMFDDLVPEGTWGQEASHALARGSFRAAASVPGTLATLMEAGARMPSPFQPGSGIPGAPTRVEHAQTVRSLRRTAKDIYQAASAPSLAPKRGGVGGYILNTMLETAPLLAASTAATVVAGPAGGFGVGAMAMGEEGYQTAKAGGADDATAEAERAINFMIGGALERLQADEVLKLGKGSVKAIVKAARERAWKKLGKEAGKLTTEQLAGAASEGLTESLQEATLIGSAALHGEKIATMENLKRVGVAGVGGFTAGGLMKAGGTLLMGGTPETGVIEPRPADAPAYEDEPAPATVPMTMEELGREIRGDQPELPIVGEETPQGEPRIHVQAELGKDVTAEPGTADDGYKMSARQADVDVGRGRRDMEPVEPQDSIPWVESARQAQERGIKDKALAIATTINAEPRALTHVETAGMVDKAIELDNQYEQLTAQMTEANSKGDAQAVKVLSTAINQNQADYDSLTRAIYTSGSEKGRDLASQKLTKGRDFRLASVVARATAAKGAPLTTEEQAGLAADVKQLQETVAAATPVERKAAEETAADTLGLPTTGQRKGARRPPRKKGLRRYLTMTEVEKDAELQTLLGRDKDAKTLTKIADNLASRGGVENFEDVARKMTELIPGIERATIVDAINTATQRQARTTDAALQRLQEIARRQPKTNKKLRTTIADILYYLNTGQVPEQEQQAGRGETWDVNQQLANVRDMLRKEMRNTEASQKQRLAEQIAYLESRLANDDLLPRSDVMVRHTPELDRLRYEKARLQHKIRQRIAAMRPRTPWQTVMAPFRFIQSLKSAFDVSAVRRQGGWMVLTHPVRSLRRVPDMFRAAWSDAEAFRLNEEIANRPNAPRYALAKLEFTDPGGTLTEREEMFRSDFAEKIPGISASNRAYATFLNLVRADAFDAMTDAFLADGGAGTQVEETAIANYINVATGRGATGSMKAAADAMNGLFWSPRYVISRFQLIFGQPFYHGTARTQKMIAKEYARYLMGLIVVYTLGKMAGGDLEDDSRSSDFGKIRFGNTRLDPLSGLAQTVTFISRVASGKTTRASGEVVPIRGRDIPYGGDNTADVIARFLRTKLAPAPGMFVDVAAGENVVGEPTTAWGMAKGAVIPLSMSDIYDTMVEQGIPAGTVLSILGIFGEGVQTYQPKEKHNTVRSYAARRRGLRRGME